MNKYFSSRLKKLREDHGLSQAELADKLSISRGSISFYENNSRVPDIDILFSLCKYFSVTSDYLIGLSDDPEQKPTATKDLGLSYAAVDRLLAWNTRYPDGKTGLSALSRLIVHSRFFHMLLHVQTLFSFAESGAIFTHSAHLPPDDLIQMANKNGYQLVSNGTYGGIIISYIKDSFGEILSKIVSYEDRKAAISRLPDSEKYSVTSVDNFDLLEEFIKELGRTKEQTDNQTHAPSQEAETDK